MHDPSNHQEETPPLGWYFQVSNFLHYWLCLHLAEMELNFLTFWGCQTCCFLKRVHWLIFTSSRYNNNNPPLKSISRVVLARGTSQLPYENDHCVAQLWVGITILPIDRRLPRIPRVLIYYYWIWWPIIKLMNVCMAKCLMNTVCTQFCLPYYAVVVVIKKHVHQYKAMLNIFAWPPAG